MIVFEEIYEILFISSIIFMVYLLLDLIMKVYGRFVKDNENMVFKITPTKMILFWFSIAIFLSYLI